MDDFVVILEKMFNRLTIIRFKFYIIHFVEFDHIDFDTFWTCQHFWSPKNLPVQNEPELT